MKIVYFLTVVFLSFHLQGYAGEKRALIVAISQYPKHSGWNTIHTDNDVKILTNTLEKKGFQYRNIIVLNDSSATKKRVVAAFRSLQQRVKAGDFVFIHFSCHGQQMEDDNGDEPDGLDEALVCYDAKMFYSSGKYEGENHLRDDQLDSLLLPIRKKLGETGNLIVSLDACHSESATRGDDNEDVVIRGTSVVFSRSAAYQGKKAGNIPKPPLKQEKGLCPITELAACKSDQNNYECKIGDKYYGSLTYALCKVWNAHNVLPAWSVWSEEVKKEMEKVKMSSLQSQIPVFRTTLKENGEQNK
ncbi:MAG: caspase family protein [Candidatus Azobacteroides sp.]|nr:caspase family protein [Candidatus Azobacteroides sp.]